MKKGTINQSDKKLLQACCSIFPCAIQLHCRGKAVKTHSRVIVLLWLTCSFVVVFPEFSQGTMAPPNPSAVDLNWSDTNSGQSKSKMRSNNTKVLFTQWETFQEFRNFGLFCTKEPELI